MGRRFALTVALAPLLVLAGSVGVASAAPPNSGIDQYVEGTPGAGGDQPGGGGGGNEEPAIEEPAALPEQSTGALESEPAGAAALDAAASTASGDADPSHRSADASRGGDTGEDAPLSAVAPSDSQSGIGATVSEVTGGDSRGMGVALPIILAATFVAAAAVAVTRRRRGGDRTYQS
jgi:hypothetical protein